MVFVDSNIPMYLIGDEHPLKSQSRATTRRLLTQGTRLVTNAEVFQEILHRYTSIGRRDRIAPAFKALRGLVESVLPITEEDAMLARNVALAHPSISARDAIHAAVMERHGVAEVLSFDRGFDQLPGIRRLPRD